MARPRKLWSVTVGQYGHQVTACERRAGGLLSLRWWNAGEHKVEWKSLGHSNQQLATEAAKKMAGDFLAATVAASTNRATWGEVSGRYWRDVGQHRKSSKDIERHLKIWSHRFGDARDVTTLSFVEVDAYVRERKAGTIAIEELKLKKDPSNRAVAAEIETLQAVLNHAFRSVRPDGTRVLVSNPLKGYKLPRNRTVRRPVASYDRYLALMKVADQVDAQGLFGGLLTLVESTGRRISSLCSLRACDVDLKASPAAPYGRLYRDPSTDKMESGGWVPMSADTKAAIESILEKNPCIGDAYLFPAPRSKPEDRKCWTRHHAKALLERAEAKAELDRLEGSQFHAFRRSWASARKGLPVQDVAKAGGWTDLRCLQTLYSQADEATVLAVVTSPNKIRDPKQAPKESATG